MTEPESQLFKQWDIVLAEFPYRDRAGQKPRPVLVVSGEPLTVKNNKVWCVMISALIDREKKPRILGYGDIVVSDFQQAGLRRPSFYRVSKFTFNEVTNVHERVGSAPDLDRILVEAVLRHYLFL